MEQIPQFHEGRSPMRGGYFAQVGLLFVDCIVLIVIGRICVQTIQRQIRIRVQQGNTFCRLIKTCVGIKRPIYCYFVGGEV